VIASRIAEFEQLQIDRNQCRRSKDYYGFDHPKGVAEPAEPAAPAAALAEQAYCSLSSFCRARPGGVVMTAPVPEYSTHVYEMMTRLGIEPGAGVLPQLSLRYATAVRRCENCRSKKGCQDWLDYTPAMVNFAPDFCVNADILFDLQYDQAGPLRAN
jgi:uncharacterized protein DUF6455